MIANLVNTLVSRLFRSGSDLNSTNRSRRVDRRVSFSMGLEDLEGRIAPGTVVAPVIVTVTNQPTYPTTPTYPTAPAPTQPTVIVQSYPSTLTTTA